MDGSPHAFALKLTCDRSYLAGFPLIVAVEVRNLSSTHFGSLVPFGLFTVPGPVSFVLRGGGREWTWPEMSPSRDEEPEGVPFEPGKAWLALQDLSELHPDIPPGRYELSATIVFPGELVRAESVPIEIHASSKQEQAAAAKLRATNDRGKSSWRYFIRDNWATPETSGLSEAGRERLAYYLYLHRVIYGPQPVAGLDPDEPSRFGHGALEGEAALLRLEILLAAPKPQQAAGVEAAIRERWPGLTWRVEDIHAGSGVLTRLRKSSGAERSDLPADKPRPYQKAK